MPIRTVLLALAGVVFVGVTASAQQGRPVAILIPGAGGPVPIDFLMRNQSRISSAGIETKVATSPREAVAIAKAERKAGRKVVIVGMSRGASMAASALAAGAPANGVVFVSGGLDDVRSRLGAPARLPRTLVVHHRQDACVKTPPQAVPAFVGWSRGKARVVWVNTSGAPPRNPCGPRGAHGYFMQDGPAVSAIINFVR